MSKNKKVGTAAESGKPLTEEELQAVVGGGNFIDEDPSNPSDDNPSPPAPDPPPLPSDITS